MRHYRLPLVLLPLLIAGCAGGSHPAVIVAAPPPAVVVEVMPLPAGASPGMLVPQPLANGSFPTPNQQLSAAGTLWHLRAGLNVAALSCPGEEGAAIRAGYNGWLKRDKVVLARAVKSYAAEYRIATPAGRAAYDDAMTRLYNFFSQTPVRPAFCTTAARLTATMSATAPATLAATAPDRLATLDAPFTDFYRAYDGWRSARPLSVIAAAAVTSPGPAAPQNARPGPVATPRPRLVLDLSSLPPDDAVIAAR